jgi:hypothetical protein
MRQQQFVAAVEQRLCNVVTVLLISSGNANIVFD